MPAGGSLLSRRRYVLPLASDWSACLVIDHLVEWLLLARPSHGVLHAGAAALLDADAGPHDVRSLRRHDCLDALGGGLRQHHHLGARSRIAHAVILLSGGRLGPN